MSLVSVTETMELFQQQKKDLSAKEIQFITQFYFKTGDTELTESLIQELNLAKEDFNEIQSKYVALYDEKPQWIGQIENLLIALEMYRIEEEKAIKRLSDILKAYGIEVTEEEIRMEDTETIKERVKKEAAI